MHVIISPLNTTELCRAFRRDVATTKRQIVTLEVKNLRNNRKKNQQYRIMTKIDDNDGHVAAGIYPYSYLAYIHDVIGHPCCHSSRNDFLYYQRKNVPGSQLLSYRFATSEKRMLQVRADVFQHLGVLLIPLLNGTHTQKV